MDLKLYHFMPDKLNLYGDIGNVIALKKRCEWRGINLEIENITSTDGVKLTDCDMFFIGGGSDREQCIATEQFSKIKNLLLKMEFQLLLFVVVINFLVSIIKL